MQRKTLITLPLALLSLLMTACSGNLFAAPTLTPTATPTFTPTLTPTNTTTPTYTPLPTDTPIPPTFTPTPDLPKGKPVAVWQGIPIMPNAIAGEGTDKAFKFITAASVDEVMAYYVATMPKYGWKYEQTMPDGPGKYIFILPRDQGGYIIELGGPFDLMIVYEENGLTRVNIYYTP
jgi:hypothetical protein